MPSLFKTIGAVLCLVFALCFAAPNARADTVTLIVSGSLSPVVGTGSACSGSGCTLGGDIVINNTTGAVISEDVTISGESPSIGPFTINSGIFATVVPPGNTIISLDSATPGDNLRLLITTSTSGSLVGYDGGPLLPGLSGSLIGTGGVWNITSGALTPSVTPTPEPTSLALMLSGVGLVFAMRKRFSGLQLAS